MDDWTYDTRTGSDLVLSAETLLDGDEDVVESGVAGRLLGAKVWMSWVAVIGWAIVCCAIGWGIGYSSSASAGPPAAPTVPRQVAVAPPAVAPSAPVVEDLCSPLRGCPGD